MLMYSTNIAQRDTTRIEVTKSGYKEDLKLVNPTNKDREMVLNDLEAPYYRVPIKVTKFWFDLKRKLKDKTGIQINLNYTPIFIGATSTITPDDQLTAASGIFDATIKWTFINRKKDKNKGTLFYTLESRHNYYGDVTPMFLNFGTGSALFPALRFREFKFRTYLLYYQQAMFNDRLGFAIGKIDPTDWFTYNGLLHPSFHFVDYAFSVNPTVNWSNTGLGVVVGGWLDKKKRFGLVAGIHDLAGDNLDRPNFLDMGASLWPKGKFLKIAEFSFTPGSDRFYFNRVSVTGWHSDKVTPNDDSFLVTESSYGFSAQATWFIKEKYIPVVTVGWSDGQGSNVLSKFNVSLMHAWFYKSHDMLGVGLNYTISSISLRSQLLAQVFYRLTLSRAFAITPFFTGVLKPALDPTKDLLAYYGIRIRASL